MVWIVLSVIITIGIIGNILNLIVFSKKPIRQLSTFRFLMYLSITDMLVLIVCATNTVTSMRFNFDLRLISPASCRMHKFLTYFLRQLSSNILMVISIERVAVIKNNTRTFLRDFCIKLEKKNKPNYIRRIPKLSYMKISNMYKDVKSKFFRVDLVIIVMVSILSALNSHYLLEYKLTSKLEDENYHEFLYDKLTDLIARRPDLIPQTNQSDISEPIELFTNMSNSSRRRREEMTATRMCKPTYDKDEQKIWKWIDLTVDSIVPFCVMTICSVIILHHIRKTSKMYFQLVINAGRLNKKNVQRRIKRNRQLLYMLLVTNFYFLATMLPYLISTIMFSKQIFINRNKNSIINSYLYTNNAVNFLFYGFSSKKYREELYFLFRKPKYF